MFARIQIKGKPQNVKIVNVKNGRMTTFEVKVITKVKDIQDNWVDRHDLYTVATFGDVAEQCAEHLKDSKIMDVFVEGYPKFSTWKDKKGREHASVQINAQKVFWTEIVNCLLAGNCPVKDKK